jgi:hypothetical protein
MNKNINGIIAVLVVAGLGYFAYKKLGKPNSVKVITNYLDATYGGDHKEAVSKMEKGYLNAWSDALMNGSKTFEYNGSTYKTGGGKKTN